MYVRPVCPQHTRTQPPGTVTVREVAESLALSPEEVQAFYKMGLRARSYILMSMHSIISALANKYAGAFSIGREVGTHCTASSTTRRPLVREWEAGPHVGPCGASGADPGGL